MHYTQSISASQNALLVVTDDHPCDSQWPCWLSTAKTMQHSFTYQQDGHIYKTQNVWGCLEIAASRANLQAASRLSCEAQSARLALHEHFYSAVVAANGCPLQVFNGLFQQRPYSAKSAQGLNP